MPICALRADFGEIDVAIGESTDNARRYRGQLRTIDQEGHPR